MRRPGSPDLCVLPAATGVPMIRGAFAVVGKGGRALQIPILSPVPVDTDQDGPGPLTAQHRQPFHSHSGNTAAVGWHRNDGYILLCQLYRAKIGI